MSSFSKESRALRDCILSAQLSSLGLAAEAASSLYQASTPVEKAEAKGVTESHLHSASSGLVGPTQKGHLS